MEGIAVSTEEQRRKHAEEMRKARANDPERYRQHQRDARLRDPEAHRRRQRTWRSRRTFTLKVGRFVSLANQRAARFGVSARLSNADVRATVGDCAYCGGTSTTWDHIVPLCRGGANTRENLASCCRHCNQLKAFRTPDEWRAGITVSRNSILRPVRSGR